MGEKQIELWRDVVGYEEFYEVSNNGNIRSKDRLVKHSIADSVFIRKGKPRKTSTTSKGYKRIVLSDADGSFKTFSVHRLVAISWIDNPLNKRTVNHIDGNKLNNNVTNLEWCTHSENTVHAHKNNLTNPARGEQFKTRAKLNNVTVSIVRECASVGFTHKQISEYFKIGRETITRVVNRKIWRHVL